MSINYYYFLSSSKMYFATMPNHLHGLISIIKPVGGEFNSSRNFMFDSSSTERADLKPAPTKQYGISEITRGFKTFTTRKINKKLYIPAFELEKLNE